MNKFYVIDPKTKRALSGPHGEGHLTLPAGMQLWDGSEADGYCVINNANGGKAMVGTLTLRGGDFIWTSDDDVASNLNAGYVYGPSGGWTARVSTPGSKDFYGPPDDKPDDLYGRLRY